MKITFKTSLGGFFITMSAVFLTGLVNAQTTPNFTSVNATPENAIQLYWASDTNGLYEIDYADALATNSDGSTTWNKLYDDYPSQGTNTFVADCGNYDLAPEVVHPSLSPMRFYRVTLTGTSTSPTNPTVSIASPTSGAALSGDVAFSVAASSPELLTEVQLYIDGEEQWSSLGGTNFDVNTCEWLNGQHTIYAIAKSQSGIDGFTFGTAVTYGYAVSPFVNVTFSNLVSEVALSQPYFEPSLGETQEVTAQFAANCDWTLQIQDANSNIVRDASGSGGSMVFDWDGTGDGGTNIPDGVYSYVISAQTNGLALPSSGGGGGSGGGSPPTPMVAGSISTGDTSQLYAADGSADFAPLAIYPPGFDTNGLTIIEATPSEIQSLKPKASISRASVASQSSGFYASADYSGASSQSTRAPKRKPRVGVKNSSGTYGVCYNTYPDGATIQEPTTGWPYPLRQFVGVDGAAYSSSYHYFTPLKTFKAVADGFSQVMKIGAAGGSYKAAFVRGDGQWGPSDIEKPSLGGNSVFNTCNFGMLLTHGIYGTQSEDDNVKYTYFLLANPGTTPHWVRLADLDLGSAGANGLRWFTTFSCSILNSGNVNSMINNSRMPDNSNLHLLLGATTDTYSTPLLGAYYGTNLIANFSIWQSMQNAGAVAYQEAYNSGAAGMTNTVTFRVMGYQSCINDSLFQYNDPNPDTDYQILNQTVFIP